MFIWAVAMNYYFNLPKVMKLLHKMFYRDLFILYRYTFCPLNAMLEENGKGDKLQIISFHKKHYSGLFIFQDLE